MSTPAQRWAQIRNFYLMRIKSARMACDPMIRDQQHLLEYEVAQLIAARDILDTVVDGFKARNLESKKKFLEENK